MTFSVLVFRQSAIREALEEVVAELRICGDRRIVDTPCAARRLVRSQHVDVIIVGREYIEDVPGILKFCPNPSMTMTVLLAYKPSSAIRARARMNDIDVVADTSVDLSAMIALLSHEFKEFQRRAHRKSSGSVIESSGIWVGDSTDVEIVEMIAAGYSDREIAAAVCLNHQTVRNHVSRILCQSGARNRTHLAAMYLKSVCAGSEPFDPTCAAGPTRRTA
jgi:DNA-binding NarL/FixJ family response regulator